MRSDFLGAGYASPIALDRGNADPLDLASTNERLYNSVFPGYNNAVRFIRVYSALAWMAHEVERQLKELQPQWTAEADEAQRFAMEKMELVLLWANRQRASMAGARRKFPENRNERQLLKFSEWKNDASLMAAVQYGPSITNGLGFLDSNWICSTDAGRSLAAAFAQNLGQPRAHRWLADITSFEATGKQVEALDIALDVTRPSAVERQVFTDAFFPRRKPLKDSRGEDRWHSLHLVLNCIGAISANGAPATESAIRKTMARGTTERLTNVLRPGLGNSHAMWGVLQLRQLQRFACESLLAVVMIWVDMHQNQGFHPEDCARDMAAQAEKKLREQGIHTCNELRQRLHSFQGRENCFFRAAARGVEYADLFSYLDALRTPSARSWHEDTRAVELNVVAITFCAIETRNLLASPDHAAVLRDLASERGSLVSLESAFARFGEHDVREWISHLVLEWVFARYFEVAVNRSAARDGKLRFDFTDDEAGLRRGSQRGTPFGPSIAKDKLTSTLALMTQCGLIRYARSGYELTDSGRTRVRNYEAHGI